MNTFPILKKIIRFFEIDINYLFLPLPIGMKFLNVVKTDFFILWNLVSRRKVFSKIYFNSVPITYDTSFATKTFLTAVYDFYLETKKGTIFLKDNPFIIDVGANIGQFMIAIKTFFPDATIFSVEPDPKIYKILKSNASHFKKITVYNSALSNVTKQMNFYISQEFSEWSSLKKLEGKKYEKIEVNAVRGDNLFKSVPQIDLLKIDVEGAELSVILGMGKILKKCRFLMIEVSLERMAEDPGSNNLIDLLIKNDFYIYHIGRIFSAGKGEEQGAVDIIFKNKRDL